MLRSPPRTHVDARATPLGRPRSAKAALRIRMALGPTPWILRSSVSECSLTFSKLSIPANWSSRGGSLSQLVRKVANRAHIRSRHESTFHRVSSC